MSSADDVVVGLDVGGTNLRTGITDSKRNLQHFRIQSSRELLQGADSGTRLVNHIKDYLSDTGVNPRAISVGFPSTVDRTRRVVLSTSNIPGLDSLPFADLVESATSIPTFLNRDTNMHLLHDLAALDLEQKKIVIGCYPGTGFGSGLWIGGKLHIGKTGSEGELGHMPVKGIELRCGCGNTGCVETIASGLYLEHLLQTHFPDTAIGEAFSRHGASFELRDFVDNLSLPIATAINILDPDAVIIGGGVVAMDDFPWELLTTHIWNHTRKPEPAKNLRLEFAAPRQENAVIGAGIYAFGELEK